MVKLEVENLKKVFGTPFGDDVVAVDNVSLEVTGNHILTLVGPSGCGKTTTLRCIAGLESPTSGAVYLDDENVVDQPPQERNVAMLFQDIALWNHMTVRENMAFSLRINNYDTGEVSDRIQQAAEELQITDKLDQKPPQLSGGQQQRVALGRAIVQDPDLFLFDEPLSALDAALKREIRPLIQRIVKEAGVPAVYVTHDQEEAMTLSDRIAVMNGGEVEQFSTPLEIYQQPSNRFVAQFIGNPQMNFFKGMVSEDGDKRAIDIHGIEIPAPPGASGDVTVGVRPQDISVKQGDDPVGVQANHLLDEPRGDMTHSYFDTKHGEFIAVTRPQFKGNGDSYRLTFNPEDAHLFDESGGRLSEPKGVAAHDDAV